MVENPPSNAGDVGLIPGQGTNIPNVTGQLSPRAATTELVLLNREPACLKLQSPRATTRERKPARHN